MTPDKLERTITLYAFFMCSSFMMFFGVNISMFVFVPILLFVFTRWGKLMLRPNSYPKLCLYVFMFGALASTVNNLALGNTGRVSSSLAVLPNYIYWCVIVFVFSTLATKHQINYEKLFGAISIGVFLAIFYVFVLQPYLPDNMFLKYFGPNNLAFLLICLTPHCILWLKKKSAVSAIAVLAIILAIQLLEGRRAGFILVLAGGFLAYNARLVKLSGITDLLRGAAILASMLLVLQLPYTEKIISQASPRVAAIIYSGTETLDDDRSYLTRLAMIEKGLALFRESPLFGAGLNTFTSLQQEIEGDFEGSQFVVHKDIYSGTSSHNSYINILAEGGLFLFIPTIALFCILIVRSILSLSRFSEHERVLFISVTMMLIHMSVTNGIVNSLAWFNIALLTYATTRLKYMLKLKTQPAFQPSHT
jgi:O-antigen ligase